MAERNVTGEADDHSFALATVAGSVPAMVLKAVIELDVLEIIKRAGPGAQLSAAEIAAQLPAKNPDAGTVLDRMLRVLASYEVFSCSERSLPNGRVQRLYGLAPVCHLFTKNEDGGSLEALSLLIQDKVLMECWYYLKDAVLNGDIPFNKAHNMTVYEYTGIDARFNKLFNDGMSKYSTLVMNTILKNYKGFEHISTLVDVAGGVGTNISMIISKYPAIKGINFDLPHVLKDAPTYKGVEHVGGDMFVSIPKGDAIFLKWVCCDWDDEHCLKILKNCYAAIPDHGKVIVCDFTMLPVASNTSNSMRVIFNFDVFVLATFVGGRFRTEQEFEELGKLAGFEIFKMSRYDIYLMMEFMKKN